MMRQRDALAAFNERIKLLAGFFNATGLGFIGFAVLRPLVEGTLLIEPVLALWLAAGLALHGIAHYILRYLEKEIRHDD